MFQCLYTIYVLYRALCDTSEMQPIFDSEVLHLHTDVGNAVIFL